MSVHKFDHPPLLAPGRHFMTLGDIEARCVRAFTGAAEVHREKLYYSLEELCQKIMRVGLRCTMFVDGSYLTEKMIPDDLDLLINIDLDVIEQLTVEQRILVDQVNQTHYAVGLDSLAFTAYPRGHQYFGSILDIGNAGDAYGLEHAKVWLKGIAVLRFGETGVGLRICR